MFSSPRQLRSIHPHAYDYKQRSSRRAAKLAKLTSDERSKKEKKARSDRCRGFRKIDGERAIQRRKEETNPVHMRPIRSPSPDCRVSFLLLSAATTATTLPIKPTHFILLPKTKKFQKVKILFWQ